MRSGTLFVLGVATLGLAACGGGGGGGGSCTPGPTAALTVTDTGFSNGTNNACVQLGGLVTFTNSGASAHTIVIDTLASSCPTTPASPIPIPTGSPVTVTFPTTAVNCNFHLDSNTALSGTVAVTSAAVSGGGY